MSSGFRKRTKIAPGLFMNLSKSGVGWSVGRRDEREPERQRPRQLSLDGRVFYWRKWL